MTARVFNSIQRRQALLLAGAAALTTTLGSAAFAAAAKPKIGTIGAGNIGKALGTALVKAGYQVKFSTRHPEELKDFVAGLGPNASAGTVEQAIAFGDVVMIMVPYSSMPQVAKDYGKALATKALVMDVSNPRPDRDGPIANEVQAKGAGLWLAGMMPGARIVRAFNAVGAGSVAAYGQKHVAVPIAGDDQNALKIASDMARDIGFDPVVVGDLKVAGKLIPYGTKLGGEYTAAEMRDLVASMK